MTTKDRVIAEAKKDAALFVEEFGEPIDPFKTDWDADAWADAAQNLGLDNDEYAMLWEAYQTELVAETERLTQGKT
jgi:hypothetical protein